MTSSDTVQKQGDQADIASEQNRDDQLNRLRVDIAVTIKNTFPRLFWLTVTVAFVLILLVALGFAFGRTMDATVLAASIQVAFGMVIGFVCVYIGLMMTWFGIDAAYTLKGRVGSAEGALKSASPGLLFALAGIVLISVSLHKRIEYSEGGYRPVDFGNAAGGGETPKGPTDVDIMNNDPSNRLEVPE